MNRKCNENLCKNTAKISVAKSTTIQRKFNFPRDDRIERMQKYESYMGQNIQESTKWNLWKVTFKKFEVTCYAYTDHITSIFLKVVFTRSIFEYFVPYYTEASQTGYKTTWRLINLLKSDIGKINKSVLDKRN